MNDQLLVPIQTIKQNSQIEPNVEPTRLRPIVLRCQRINVANIIGSALLKWLLSKVQPDGTLSGLNAIQEEFYQEHIVPLLALHVEAEFTASGGMKRSNVGPNNLSSDKAHTPDLNDVKWVYGRIMNSADSVAMSLRRFMQSAAVRNDEIYTLFTSCDQNRVPDQRTNQAFTQVQDDTPSLSHPYARDRVGLAGHPVLWDRWLGSLFLSRSEESRSAHREQDR